MCTGERAFPGDTQASIIASILNRQPPAPSARQPLSPPALDHIVWRALAKDPEDRWQTARDVYLELRTRGITPTPATAQKASPTGWLMAGLALLAVVGGSLASGWMRGSALPAPVIRAVVPPPDRMLYQLTGDYAGPPMVSPDGLALVFAAIDATGRRQLWLRRLDSLTAEPLPGTEDATFPFWAPDSRAVGFFADAKLKRIDLNAGSALTLCEAPSGRGGSWNAQGTILFTPTVVGGLHQVSASGGSPVAVTREALGGAPVAVARDVLEDPTIWRGIFSASDTGTLIYQGGQAGTVLTLYDRDGHEVVPIGDQGIIFDVNMSPDGTRVAVNRGDPADIWVYELDRGTSLRLTFDVRNETLPVWSADSQRLAFNQTQKDATTTVYEIAAAGGAPRQVLPPGNLAVTDWSRDGRVMLLRQGEMLTSPGDIWARPLDGPPRALLETPFAEYHARFSPDTRWVSWRCAA